MRIFLAIFCLYFLPVTDPEISLGRISQVKDYTLKQDFCHDYAIFIDMSLPSNKKRWYVIDLETKKIIYKTYVAHGKGSGEGKQATSFSDRPGSYCTALGIYKIKGSCIGEHGLSYIRKKKISNPSKTKSTSFID